MICKWCVKAGTSHACCVSTQTHAHHTSSWGGLRVICLVLTITSRKQAHTRIVATSSPQLDASAPDSIHLDLVIDLLHIKVLHISAREVMMCLQKVRAIAQGSTELSCKQAFTISAQKSAHRLGKPLRAMSLDPGMLRRSAKADVKQFKRGKTCCVQTPGPINEHAVSVCSRSCHA